MYIKRIKNDLVWETSNSGDELKYLKETYIQELYYTFSLG
jgi:hypothetical protein